MADHPIKPGRDSAYGPAALERRTIHIHDVQADPEYTFGAKEVEAFRTVLAVPMLKGDELLGVIVTYRLEVKPFTDKQIALVETFADQAVIAIENVRLFDEVQARTRELSASRWSNRRRPRRCCRSSRARRENLQPVFQAMLANAMRICAAQFGCLCFARRRRLPRGRLARRSAQHFECSRRRDPDFSIDPEGPLGRRRRD